MQNSTNSEENARTLCFTGHRPKDLFGYNHRDAYSPLLGRLVRIIKEAYILGFRRVITGGAQGLDQLAFWAAEHARRTGCEDLRNSVFLPSPLFGTRWQVNGMFGRSEFHSMLALADDVHYVCTVSVPFAEAADRRNRAMVDLAGMVIGVCTKSDGGTANCLWYAIETERDVAVLDPVSLRWTFRKVKTVNNAEGSND